MSIDGPQSLDELAANPYQRILGNAARQHRLVAVHWDLTYRCNERCSHCYLDVLPPHARVPDELTTDECLGIVDQIAGLGALNLTLSGGEILTRKDWFEIASHARSKRLLLRLFTNGILINARTADRIADLHPYMVEMSLYSARPEVHERITRRPRSWDLTTRAARLLYERGVRVQLKTPVMRENMRELEALKSLAESLGASFRYTSTITLKLTGLRDPLQHRLGFEDLVRLYQETMDTAMWLKRELPPDQGTCGIGQLALLIDPYGKVYPCTDVHIEVGDLRVQPLNEIWNTSPLWQELNRLKSGDLPVCSSCDLRNLCVRCHGIALVEDGNLVAPASANCLEALARRQVLVQRGDLPADFSVPQHMQAWGNILDRDLTGDLNDLQHSLAECTQKPIQFALFQQVY